MKAQKSGTELDVDIIILKLSMDYGIWDRKRSISFGNVISIVLCLILSGIYYSKNIELLNKFSEVHRHGFGASVLGLFTLFRTNNILNCRIFEWSNKISFNIYLLHMPIICSIGFYLYDSECSIPFIFCMVTVVLVLLSLPFHLFIEEKLTNKFMKCLNV